MGKHELSVCTGGGLGREAGRFLGGLYAAVLTNDTRVIEETGAFGEYFGQFTPLNLITGRSRQAPNHRHVRTSQKRPSGSQSSK